MSRKKAESNDALRFVIQGFKYDQEELRIWRERYPHRAPFISEEARSKIDGREPNWPAPYVIG